MNAETMSKDITVDFERMKLTKSQLVILEILRENGRTGSTPKEIQCMVPFASRTVRYALRTLLHNDIVMRIPCLQDMRQSVYILR